MTAKSVSPTGVVLADNLEVLRRLPAGCVDLIYTDPLFGTGQTRRLESIRTGAGDRVRTGFAGSSYRYEVRSTIRWVGHASPHLQVLDAGGGRGHK